MKTVIFALVTGLHNLFTAVWIGGLIVTLITYLPVLKKVLGPGPQLKNVMTAFQKRQSLWVIISMLGLVLTGLLLSKRDPQFVGLFSFDNPFSIALSIKHILVLLMIAISLYRSLVLGRAGSNTAPNKEKVSFSLLVINTVLAFLVLFSTGAITAISQAFLARYESSLTNPISESHSR